MSVHPLSYFDGMYADDPDPWGFDRLPYERRKQDLTVAALPAGRHFARAVEPGCANGALTARLVEVCDEVIAFDPIASCVERATDRLDGTNERLDTTNERMADLSRAVTVGFFSMALTLAVFLIGTIASLIAAGAFS